MQDFKFKSYIEFFDFISDKDKVMVTLLKDLIEDHIPNVKQKLSWNVPFFYRKKSICFIWPGSIPWGKKTYEGVQLGFNKGYLMKENNYLEKGQRKQVYIKTYSSVSEIEDDIEIIGHLLREAEKLDS